MAKGSSFQSGPHWNKDYFEVKSKQNPENSGKHLYLPHNCLKDFDRGPTPGRELSLQLYYDIDREEPSKATLIKVCSLSHCF